MLSLAKAIQGAAGQGPKRAQYLAALRQDRWVARPDGGHIRSKHHSHTDTNPDSCRRASRGSFATLFPIGLGSVVVLALHVFEAN